MEMNGSGILIARVMITQGFLRERPRDSLGFEDWALGLHTDSLFCEGTKAS